MKCPSHDTVIKNTGASVVSELRSVCIVGMCAAFVLFRNTVFLGKDGIKTLRASPNKT